MGKKKKMPIEFRKAMGDVMRYVRTFRGKT